MNKVFILLLFAFTVNATNVLTVSGYKDIKSIAIGDTVIGKNNAKNIVKAVRTFNYGWYAEQNIPNEYQWYLINGVYKLFGNQSIILKTGKYNCCHASELEVGWKIIDQNNKAIKINTIEKIAIQQDWYKLDISGDHSYICDSIVLHNASRYWVGNGATANWNATGNTNWSATNGGANNASVPGSGDDVTLNGNGANGNSNGTVSTTITILSLTFSAYTGTVTLNSTLTCAGNFTDTIGHGWAGSGAMTLSATCTIKSQGKTFPNTINLSTNSTTKTLDGNWTIGGTLTWAGFTNVALNKTTSETVTCGGLTMTSSAASGTAKIILASGTWTGTGQVINDLDIAGNVTLSGSINFNTKTLTYVSGTVTLSSSTITFPGSCTLNTNGMTFGNINITQSITLTINSLLSANAIVTISAGTDVTFGGTAGFSFATLTLSHSGGNTITLTQGNTYTVTTALNAFRSSVAGNVTITSSHATNKVTLTLNQGATCNVCAILTRIDASGGRPINTFNGTVTNCINVFSYTDLKTLGF